jgi:hypothetical protein
LEGRCTTDSGKRRNDCVGVRAGFGCRKFLLGISGQERVWIGSIASYVDSILTPYPEQ